MCSSKVSWLPDATCPCTNPSTCFIWVRIHPFQCIYGCLTFLLILSSMPHLSPPPPCPGMWDRRSRDFFFSPLGFQHKDQCLENFRYTIIYFLTRLNCTSYCWVSSDSLWELFNKSPLFCLSKSERVSITSNQRDFNYDRTAAAQKGVKFPHSIFGRGTLCSPIHK